MPELEIRGPDGEARTVKVKDAAVVGRDAGCEVQITEKKSSRRQFRIEREEGGAWVLQDLDSSNGTFVGEVRVLRHRLADGDVVRVGDTHLTWRERAVPQAPLVGGRLALRAVGPGAVSIGGGARSPSAD